jgi:hypothetical protein
MPPPSAAVAKDRYDDKAKTISIPNGKGKEKEVVKQEIVEVLDSDEDDEPLRRKTTSKLLREPVRPL